MYSLYYNFRSSLLNISLWSLTTKERRNLRLFENTGVGLFGPKRDEVTGVLCKLHRVGGHVVHFTTRTGLSKVWLDG
jgi:hypothetical protein